MTIHKTSYKVQIRPISVPLFLLKLPFAPSIDKNLQTPLRESSITYSTYSVMSNIEIPPGNCIDTSKLHLSKIDKLDAKFDALKSFNTREISNLANKLDSLLLKTLEKRGVSSSKLLQNNFEFLRKQILSKDKLINYLMETQTTILNLVTSAKNQEKKQEKLQKLNVPQQLQQNLQSQHR